MNNFTPWSSLLGGALIGLSATLLLLSNGRIAGISGILGGAVNPVAGDTRWRVLFLLGLVLTGAVAALVHAGSFTPGPTRSFVAVALAGVLVGFGTRMGNGCTSGHGICGLSRFSPRSLVATLTFLFTGMATVFIVRHLVGGAS